MRPHILRPGESYEVGSSRHAALLQVRCLLGLEILPKDATYSERDARAVRAFQSAAGLLADGFVGPSTWKSLVKSQAERPLPFGGVVAEEFLREIVRICKPLCVDAAALMACMAFETGETFSPSVRNPGSSATGLIQFMGKTAGALGTTTAALGKLSAVQQLEYVQRYLEPFAFDGARPRLISVEGLYMAILYPAAVTAELGQVLFRRGSPAYAANRGLDALNRGFITKEDAARKVLAKLHRGFSSFYA